MLNAAQRAAAYSLLRKLLPILGTWMAVHGWIPNTSVNAIVAGGLIGIPILYGTVVAYRANHNLLLAVTMGVQSGIAFANYQSSTIGAVDPVAAAPDPKTAKAIVAQFSPQSEQEMTKSLNLAEAEKAKATAAKSS